MRIVLTGGGTGGHFYPLIAVAEAIRELSREEKILDPEIYLLSPDPYDANLLTQSGITYIHVPSGKMRRYFSLLNFSDLLKTFWGVVLALLALFRLYPDVVLGKGGYGSFPVLLASRLLRIPVVIHESDNKPGRVNSWAGKFAKKVAVSYPDALSFFPKETVFFSGHPIRASLKTPIPEGAREFLKLEELVPVILILGGSQGARAINEAVLNSLSTLVSKYQIIHQTGEDNFEEVKSTAAVILKNNSFAGRYKPFAYLNELALRMSAAVADLAISRAGSSILELASWGIPVIVVPIPEDVSHDQTGNAFAFARFGAGVVIEERNLTEAVLNFEIDRLISDADKREKMRKSGLKLSAPEASSKIAYEVLSLALSHEFS